MTERRVAQRRKFVQDDYTPYAQARRNGTDRRQNLSETVSAQGIRGGTESNVAPSPADPEALRTPRTDAYYGENCGTGQLRDDREFARTLERELLQALERLSVMESTVLRLKRETDEMSLRAVTAEADLKAQSEAWHAQEDELQTLLREYLSSGVSYCGPKYSEVQVSHALADAVRAFLEQHKERP